jgi:large subunit ribosomal protein L33
MGKGKTVLIRLLSNAGTGYYYTLRKNPKLPRKLQLMKHDPIVNKHVLFSEAKFKK